MEIELTNDGKLSTDSLEIISGKIERLPIMPFDTFDLYSLDSDWRCQVPATYNLGQVLRKCTNLPAVYIECDYLKAILWVDPAVRNYLGLDTSDIKVVTWSGLIFAGFESA